MIYILYLSYNNNNLNISKNTFISAFQFPSRFSGKYIVFEASTTLSTIAQDERLHSLQAEVEPKPKLGVHFPRYQENWCLSIEVTFEEYRATTIERVIWKVSNRTLVGWGWDEKLGQTSREDVWRGEGRNGNGSKNNENKRGRKTVRGEWFVLQKSDESA